MADWSIALVRHGSAGSSREWVGDDLLRPLDPKGEQQARSLVEELAELSVTSIASAPPLRCRQTVAPLAAARGLVVQELAVFGEEAYWQSPDTAFAVWTDLVSSGATRVICSQGGAIPDLMERSLQHWGLPAMDTWTKKGAYWLISFSGSSSQPVSVRLHRNRV